MAEADIRDAVADTGAMPETEPHPAPIFDTGPHPRPLPGSSASVWSRPAAGAEAFGAGQLGADTPTGGAEPQVVPAAVSPAGQYHFLKRWKLALVFIAVWIPAAGAGLGLFAWWYALPDKTPAVFVVFGYVVVCTVAGLMLATVPDRPLASAFALAVLSAVFVSALAAAPLYGHYYCQVRGPCAAGILPR